MNFLFWNLQKDNSFFDVIYENACCKDDYQEVFIKCDLSCLSSFLSKKDKTLKEAESDAISYFNGQIDWILP